MLLYLSLNFDLGFGMSVALSNTYLIKRKTNSPGAKGDVYQLHEIIYIICQRVYFFLKTRCELKCS